MDALFEQFIARWTHPNYPPRTVQASEFAEVEAKFGPLPQTYKDAVSTYGLPSTTAPLLDMIVDRQLDVQDVAEFYTPEMIVAETEGWRPMGLSSDLVAVASDGGGNLFCFKTEDQPSSDAVWFFDHDLIEVYEVAPSFLEWIRSSANSEAQSSNPFVCPAP